MSDPIIEKVIAYITHGAKLLVFSQPHEPDAGIQVPAGTVEAGEPIDEAVLREAQEETGLEGLEIRAYLGAMDYDLALYGGTGTLRRHYFHLVLRGDAPARWRHFEMHPSEGEPDPIEFVVFWVKLPDDVPELAGQRGDLLHRLALDAGPL
jgi:8-oxo-dGTP pyrophosphatase MutT (NUDIX family)